jgi:hypothetical protein
MGNRCVTCGNEEYLTRHHVVPYCYRRYFPLELKSHNFHDVLSLCSNCHDKYERKADELKEKIASIYNAPVGGEVESKVDIIKYTKMATTLLSDIPNIPKSRILFLRNEIKDFFKIKRLTKKRLKKISEIKSTIVRKTHGEIVISKIDDIQSFVEMWRKHFIDNNDCKHLPEKWNVKNKIWITKV